MNDEEIMDSQVLLALGYHLRLVMTLRSATKILGILSGENLLKADTKYENSKSISTLVPWGTDDINISLISPAEILLRCAAGEMK